MAHRFAQFVLACLVFGWAGAAIAAQGIEVTSNAVVLVGSPGNSSAPSTIDYDKVKKATTEWKTIRSEGVPKSSARYELLISEMNQRIKRATQSAAQAGNRDCVVRKGDVSDARGQTVTDLTDDVISKLDS